MKATWLYNMKDENERPNVARIPRLQGSAETSSLRFALRTSDAYEGIQESASEQTQDWAETQDRQAFRRPRFKRFTLKDGRFSLLASELLIGHSLSDDSLQKRPESVGIVHIDAVVVAKGLLVKVSKQVKRLNANVGSTKTALQEAPEILKPVDVNLPASVAFSMIHEFMEVVATQPLVSAMRIGVNIGSGFDVLADQRLDVFAAGIGNGVQFDSASFLVMPFQKAQNSNLASSAATVNHTFSTISVHVASLPTDVGFVNFNSSTFATHLDEGTVLHRKPNSVNHEPCGLLGDAQSAANLVGTDPVLAVSNHPKSGKPLVQANRRVFKDSSDFERELLLGVLLKALPKFGVLQILNLVRATFRAAHYSIWPANFAHQCLTVVKLAEVDDGFL